AGRAGAVPGAGAAADGSEGGGGAQCLGFGGGAVLLAWHQDRQGTGCAGRPGARALQQWPDGTRARDQQGREQTRAQPDRGVGLAVAALATGECLESVVPTALRRREQAGAEGGHRSIGAAAADRLVALPGAA